MERQPVEEEPKRKLRIELMLLSPPCATVPVKNPRELDDESGGGGVKLQGDIVVVRREELLAEDILDAVDACGDGGGRQRGRR